MEARRQVRILIGKEEIHVLYKYISNLNALIARDPEQIITLFNLI